MGAQLVAATFANWRHLNDKPFRLLTHMALTCLDGDETPHYYVGRDQMAWVIGAEADSRGWQAAHRCVAELIKAGAIERVLFGHHGKRSEYTLNVRRRPAKGVTESIAKGVTESIERVSLSDSDGCHSVTPLGTTKEPTHDHERNNNSTYRGKYRGPVDKFGQPKISPTADEILERDRQARSAS